MQTIENAKERKMPNPTTIIAEPGKPTIVITRVFDAPARLVWEATTTPEHVRNWWGPYATELVVCEIDLQVGGAWRYVIRGRDGAEHMFSGVYKEIVPPERIVQTEIYAPYPDAAALVTATLVEKDGKTTLTSTVVHQLVEHRDAHIASGMEHGLRETYERLDALLRAMS